MVKLRSDHFEDHEQLGLYKHKFKLIIFGIFSIILIVLLYTSFSGEIPFTGKVIQERLDLNNSLSISADLTTPSLSLSGNYKEILIIGRLNSFFYLGDKKFSLANSEENHLVLTDYNGKISFDGKTISELKGKVTEVSINGVSIMPKSKETVEIHLDENFYYNSLKVDGNVLIKKLDYETSGEIILGNQKTILNLDDDNILLKNFQGSLEIDNKHFTINGLFKSLDVKGEKKISISM